MPASIRKPKGTQKNDQASLSEPQNEAEEFVEVSQRIETLTQVLYRMGICDPPQLQVLDNNQIPDLLRHFSILLTCGQKRDRDAKRVTAVTGKLTAAGRLNTMVITQNPYNPKSRVARLEVDRIVKPEKTFEEVINGDRDAKRLSAHIGDLWAAFASCDPTKDPQAYIKLLNFVISRSFRKLHARLEWRGMGELFDKIRQWKPTRSTINQRWVNVPRWLEKCITEFDPPVTMKCNIWTRDDGRKVLQWEFSDETKELWAAILAEMLGELRRAVEEAHNIRKKNGQIARPPTNEEREAIANVGLWSHNLFSYLHWEDSVVQTLLTETDLADNLLSNSPAKLTRDEGSSSNEGAAKSVQTTSDLRDGGLPDAGNVLKGPVNLYAGEAEPTNQQAGKSVGRNPILQIFTGIWSAATTWRRSPKANPIEPDQGNTSPTGDDRGKNGAGE